MDNHNGKMNLEVPKVRKSFEVLRQIKKSQYESVLSPISSPQATSTVERRGRESLIEACNKQSNQCKIGSYSVDSCDSSLGILDIDNCKGLGDDASQKLKSLSFNPGEISARSTHSNEDFKENVKPGDNSKVVDKMSNYKSNTSSIVNDIIQKAKIQSNQVDMILRTSIDPNAVKLRESLHSYKHSLSSANQLNKEKDLWNYCADDFGHVNNSNNDSYFRESMFPSSKIDMSKEETSWTKDRGILPVSQTLSLMGNSLDNTTPISIDSHFNDLRKDIGADTTNIASTSKMSVGYYFEERCKNDIHNILKAPSPQKKNPHPPLYDPMEDIKSHNLSKTYSLKGLNCDSNKTKIDDDDDSLTPEACKNYAECISINDTASSVALSLTQIRNMMGNLQTERPSILLDQMLGVKNRNVENEKPTSTKTESNNDKMKNIHSSPSSVSDSFIHNSNVFHSTKNDDHHTNVTKKNKNTLKLDINRHTKLSPIKDKDATNEQSVSPSSTFSTDLTSKTLRKFTTCSSSGLTDNTVKSVNTVIPAKISSCLNPILENTISESDENDRTLNKRDKSSADMSPGIMSVSHDRIQSSMLNTPSDVSRELKGLMSPLSGNEEKDFNTPASGRHVRRLLDKYQHAKSPVSNNTGWISPTQTRINDLSKECIPAQTPFKADSSKIQSQFEDLTTDDYEQMNRSNIADHSLNVPTQGDWIKIESQEEDILVGLKKNIKLKIVSASSRWVSVNFAVHSVYVNNQIFVDDIKNAIILQAPTSKILINADSKSECVLRLVTMIPNANIRVKIIAHLIDIVTKCTSAVEHDIKVQSQSPKFTIQSVDTNMINHLEFPTIPEQCESYLPFIMWNESSDDLPITFDIRCNVPDVFKIINVSTILEDEANDVTLSAKSSGAHLMKPNEVFTIPCGRKSALMILVQFCGPKLNSPNVTIQHIDAKLNVFLVSANKSNNIHVHHIPIYGTVGIASLLIRNSQRSDTIVIHQGGTEDIEVYNAGSITSEYKVYIATYSDKTGKCATIIPYNDSPLHLDKSEVILHPGEKKSIKINYPLGDTASDGFTKLIAFESRYITEVIDVIGVVNTRCQSQQSACSVDTISTRSQESLMKSTKKEISWGSVKLGEAKIQDIVFKNVSATRKLRVVMAVIGEGFKVISDAGSVSSMMFTLQPQECRALHIEFRALHIGGHTGMLRVAKRHNPSSNSDDITKSRTLFRAPLHGVGGHSTFIFRDGVFKHAGSQGLPLGSLTDSGLTKEIYFTIWNKGTVPGFVMFNIDLKWKYRTLGNEVCVTPQQIVIQPGAATRCTVSIPRRALLLAGGQVGDTEIVASLTVFHGDETTRLRIKKICNDEENNDSVLESWSVYSQGKLKKLCARFRDEDLNYGGISAFKETSGVLKTLLDELQQKEVMLTYDLDLDCSSARLSNDLDETLQFHTICDDDPANNTLISETNI